MFPYHDEKTTQRTSYVTLALIASGTAERRCRHPGLSCNFSVG